MDAYNILALLQAAQQAQSSPTMAGPVTPQMPTPGFRAPPLMGMSMPQAQPQGTGIPDLSGIGAGLAALRSTPAGQEPNRTAGDRDLNGYGSSPADPFGNPNAVPTIYNPTSNPGVVDWLHRRLGLF